MTAVEITDAEMQYKVELLYAMDRLAANCIPAPSGCLEWQGCLNSRGYGVISFRGRRVLTHRLAWEYAHDGERIPDELTIDHLCRNKRCVLAAHLEVVTRAENSRRANGHPTHCKYGHEYTAENTITKPRRNGATIRNCRACANERQRARAFTRQYLDREATAADIDDWIARGPSGAEVEQATAKGGQP